MSDVRFHVTQFSGALAPDDEAIARRALRLGAQDYLLKDDIDVNGHVLRHALRHIIERKEAEATLFAEQERAQVTLNSIGDAVISTDVAGHVTYLNVVAERLTGWDRREAAGRPFLEVVHIIDGLTRDAARNPMEMALELNKIVGLTPNCILIRRDGYESAIDDSAAPIHDRKGNVTGAVIVFHDVSATRAMSLQISHLAQYDFLTDLPNRLLLSERLTHALALARRRTTQLAVLFVDLDGFKHINDSLGHVVGDRLLQSVATRLSSCIRASDTVSRQGGDEFVILLSEIGHREDAAVGADKIMAALVRPHDVATHDLHITGTIGISVYPDDGQDAETLINAADTAMYHAKKISPNTYQFFKPAMNARAIERHWIEGGLRRALERRQFVLHYQPKVNLETGAMTGVEALIRWMHPQRGLLLPTQFVPVAEECGLIVPIGRWVLEEACRQNREWRDQGLPPLTVSINISAVEFRHAGLVENVCAVLHTNQLEARCLELEVTESALMQHAEFTVAVLQELKTVGVPIAVDDFGTGYSSLSYLRRFPIDVLKIDQSFVRQIEVDPTATPLVTAVIAMGKSLQLRVVAEGIETHAQLAFLQGERCDEGQGYYFRPPVVAAQLGKLLEASLGGAQSFTSW